MRGFLLLVTRGATALAALAMATHTPTAVIAADPVGPDRILSDDVTRIFTPASGALFVMITEPTAAGPVESLKRSDDGGDTWRLVNLPAPPTSSFAKRAVAVDPLNHTILYASGPAGLSKSDDDAATWRLQLQTSDRIDQIVVSQADQNLLYVSLQPAEANPTSHVMRSRDGGESWDDLLTATCDTRARLFPDPSNASRILATMSCAGQTAGLYLSQDQGATWTSAGEWPQTDRYNGGAASDATLFSGSTGRSGRWYASFAKHSLPDGVPLFRSDDAGASWQERVIGPREEVPPPDPKWQGDKFWSYVAAMDADPTSSDRVFVGVSGSKQIVRMSADGGISWTALSQPENVYDVMALAVGRDARNLYIATPYERYQTPDTGGLFRLHLSTP